MDRLEGTTWGTSMNTGTVCLLMVPLIGQHSNYHRNVSGKLLVGLDDVTSTDNRDSIVYPEYTGEHV